MEPSDTKFSQLGKAPGRPPGETGAPETPPKPPPSAKRKPKPPPPGGAPAVPPVPAKRTFIARELLSTEQSYVGGLDGLMTEFQIPLQDSQCLSAQDMITLFQNVSPLLAFHKILLQDLEERLALWDDTPCLGDVMVKATPYLKLYIVFVNNFNKVQAVLEGINKNQKALQVLMNCQCKQMQGPLGLSSLLMTPIQRIPRYVLLLKDLLEETPADHPDHGSLTIAHQSVCKIANVINERKRQEENVQKIVSIYQKLDDETKAKVTDAIIEGLVDSPHSWEKSKAESDLSCVLCSNKIPKGTKVYQCLTCFSFAHGAPKKCYEKVKDTCGKQDDQWNLVKPGRDLLRTASAEHRAVHSADQYDGVSTNKFSKEIHSKKRADLFCFNDCILILWESKMENHADDQNKKDKQPKGIKALMATSPYEFCSLFYFYNVVKKDLATVRKLSTTALEIHPPSKGDIHTIYFEAEAECDQWLHVIEERLVAEKPTEQETEVDEHGELVDYSRPLWFTLPSTCPVPTANGGSFMAYIVNIKVLSKNEERVVLKRYNQFWILHQKLKKLVGKKCLPSFPPKKWVGNMKPKFVVKRRAELSKYLNDLDITYLKLPCVQHFLSTGCETMEGEVGEDGFLNIEEGSEAPTDSTADSTESASLAASKIEDGTEIDDENGDDDDDEPQLVGPYYAIYDFTPKSQEEMTLAIGDVVYADPTMLEELWIYCHKFQDDNEEEEVAGYVPRKYLSETPPEGTTPST